jgi:hypothetical protein
LWGLRPYGGDHELAVATGAGREGGLRVRRCAGLRPHEITTERAVPVTTVARTHLDLAAVLRPHELRRVAERAEQLELFDLRAF